jgi:O-acetyl-ADP-ribose deacetylase (regulator of RNase III)
MVERRIGDKVVRLVRGDITDMEVEAFVFDITADCKLGSGYGGAIQQRGGVKIQKELDEVGSLATGQAVATTAGLLKAEHIIHTNGPKFREEDEGDKLRQATQSVLVLADEKGIKQLALPPIGTGIYQVPVDLCAQVMVDAVIGHLKNGSGLEEVVFVSLDDREFTPFEQQLQKGV